MKVGRTRRLKIDDLGTGGTRDSEFGCENDRCPLRENLLDGDTYITDMDYGEDYYLAPAAIMLYGAEAYKSTYVSGLCVTCLHLLPHYNPEEIIISSELPKDVQESIRKHILTVYPDIQFYDKNWR